MVCLNKSLTEMEVDDELRYFVVEVKDIKNIPLENPYRQEIFEYASKIDLCDSLVVIKKLLFELIVVDEPENLNDVINFGSKYTLKFKHFECEFI